MVDRDGVCCYPALIVILLTNFCDAMHNFYPLRPEIDYDAISDPRFSYRNDVVPSNFGWNPEPPSNFASNPTQSHGHFMYDAAVFLDHQDYRLNNPFIEPSKILDGMSEGNPFWFESTSTSSMPPINDFDRPTSRQKFTHNPSDMTNVYRVGENSEGKTSINVKFDWSFIYLDHGGKPGSETIESKMLDILAEFLQSTKNLNLKVSERQLIKISNDFARFEQDTLNIFIMKQYPFEGAELTAERVKNRDGFVRDKYNFFRSNIEIWCEYFAQKGIPEYAQYEEVAKSVPCLTLIFPMFLLYVEIINHIIPRPSDQKGQVIDHASELAKACQSFCEAIRGLEDKNHEIDSSMKDKIAQLARRINTQPNILNAKCSIWNLLEIWMADHRPTLLNRVITLPRSKYTVRNNVKTFINRLFCISIEHFTHQVALGTNVLAGPVSNKRKITSHMVKRQLN